MAEIGGAGALRPASPCRLDPHQTFSPSLCPTGMGSSENCIRSRRDLGGPTRGCDRRRRRSATGFAASPGQEICWFAASSLVSAPGQPMPPSKAPRLLSAPSNPKSSRKTIQHLEGGIIREILVADGDVVRAGQTLISLEDTKARAEAQSLQGQLWEATAREARLQAEQHGEERVSFPAELEMAQKASPSVAAVLAGQQAIFETRRQVFQSQAAVNREKRSQVEKEIEGLRAQESAASRRIEIVREEAATVAMLVNKGLERRPRLLNLEREMADIEGRRGEIVAQISRAGQVISEFAGNSSQTGERPSKRDRAVAARGAKPDLSDTRATAGGRRPTLANGGQGARGRRGNRPEGPYARRRHRRRRTSHGSGSPAGSAHRDCARQARGHRCGPSRTERRCDISCPTISAAYHGSMGL